MQLRFKTGLSCEEYVHCQAWRNATLPQCPLHPQGGCSLARHGTYDRGAPRGGRVARWYCPQGHRTFSLLPDCFASRLPGSLQSLEQVVATVELATSVEAAANALRTDAISLQGAIRWTRRRLRLVRTTLASALAFLPYGFAHCQPSVIALRLEMNVDCVLHRLREHVAPYLLELPPPLGFGPRYATMHRASASNTTGDQTHRCDGCSVFAMAFTERRKRNDTDGRPQTYFRSDTRRSPARMAR